MGVTAGDKVAAALGLRDEDGFTTVGMVVALLVTLALLFSAAQAYRVASASAEVQEVADVAACAAESQVADFYWVARKADAVVLSMTLLSLSMYGVGVVALCLPGAEGLGGKVLEMADKVRSARDSFAEKAASGLDQLQKALPFIAAAKAAAVGKANDGTGAAGASYYAAAILVPGQGEEVSVPAAEGLEELGERIEGEADAIAEAAQAAEEAAEKANEAKERGWRADCGDAPGHCMMERAASLAGLSGGANPDYRSVDAWSFSVALERARSYYDARRSQEAPADGSVKEGARSALRQRFYDYACDELADAYVREGEDSFEASFPELFRNTEQLRATPLYTEAAYPVTGAGSGRTMHAWAGCPNAAGATAKGSVAQLAAGGFSTCPACEFTPSSLGNVASASTSIENGFEHHYRDVAEAAADYEAARSELDPLKREVKGRVTPLLDGCLELVSSLGNARIKVSPPGSNGAIVLVANVEPMPASQGFESSFVAGGSTLGTRAAVAGAALLADERRRGSEVMANWAEGCIQGFGGLVGVAGIAYDAWAHLLYAYGDGQRALVDAIREGLDSLPLVSASGLGQWAGDALESLFSAAGLEPAELDVLKPVVVSTALVAQSCDDPVAGRYAEVQQRARSLSSSSTDLFAGIIDGAERGAYDALDRADAGITVAELELPMGGVKLPIRLALPATVKDAAAGWVEQAFSALKGLYGSVAQVRVWS